MKDFSPARIVPMMLGVLVFALCLMAYGSKASAHGGYGVQFVQPVEQVQAVKFAQPFVVQQVQAVQYAQPVVIQQVQQVHRVQKVQAVKFARPQQIKQVERRGLLGRLRSRTTIIR
jgi:hypothetical protein